jgi:uncharacterized membrane protein YkoI
MLTNVRKTALALAALGAIAFGASAIAGAAGNSSSPKKSNDSSSQSNRQAAPDPSRATHPGETLLTGDTAEKVKAAAEAKVPGATILRVETDAEGSPYEAHMRKSDGSEVTVKVDKDFNAMSVEDFGGHRGPGGPCGPPPAQNGSGSSSGTSSGAAPQTTLL